MAAQISFLVFGDQSLETHSFLTDFCQYGNPSVLTRSFLEQAGSALREEVNKLPSLQRQQIPHFNSIVDLNKSYHARNVKNPALDSALLCIAQLAQYIDRTEKEHSDATSAKETCLVGLCTGLFAAAAIASSPSVSQLLPIAIQVVLMAFRTGAHVAALASRLSNRSDSSESWTYVIPGAQESDVKSILNDFHRENGIPSINNAYISAITSKSIAISGPPSTLKSLFTSETFHAKPVSIPVHGPYHAAHLRSALNVEQILHLQDPKVRNLFAGSKTRFPVMSCTTGTWYTEQDPELLLQAALLEMLTEPIEFTKILQGCVQKAKSFSGQECLVTAFGPTSAAKVLAGILESQTEMSITVRQAIDPATMEQQNSNEVTPGKYKLAIVGMAGRFPDSASHEKLWELLESGLDVHREVPKDRFDVATHFDPTSKIRNTSHTPYGCWIENPGLFDPRFFNMSPREAYQTDPMQRLGLATAYEALEMAGYVPNRTHSTKLDRIGTFYGQTSDDWREINAAQDVDTYFITGGVRAFGPGRINYHFGFSGPSFNIDTACSSSAAALQLACTSLWAGDCDTAIVGGLSCMTNPDIFSGLSRGQFLSKNGPCATFDHDADGYCRADGVGSVIIKRLDYALADKDNVLAVILGSATNHSADAVSITHPHGGTQEILYRHILNKAGVDPNDVDYVEMHGTGTQAGDGTEMKSVTNVFAAADRKRRPDQPLYLGAVKANVGHGEAASGVTALIKVLMMLQKSTIPPHVGIKKTINQGFPKDLAERNVHIAFKSTPLSKKKGIPRRIFVNNFSAAGGNTGILLEDGPELPAKTADPRSTHVVAITAKSKSAMLNNAERLISYLERNKGTDLSDLAYTTTARRIQHKWRMTITASDISEVSTALKSKLHEQFIPVLPEPPKVAFLYTGQGSQYPAMGQELFQNSSLFRDSIMEFDNIATILGFPSFITLIDGTVTDTQGLSPVIVQLAIVCLEMAMTRLWESWGIKPSVVLGHSLGEYAALNACGILSASDTIYLVGARAQLLVEKCTAGTHAMLAVQGSRSAVTEALEEIAMPLNIACVNSTRETVLSGEAATLSQVSDRLCNIGFKCTLLKVPFAFHSAQVEPILDEFEKLAESAHFGKEQVPLISSLFGRCLTDSESVDPAYLRNHARQPVNFLDGLISSQASGIIDEKTVWLEVGPHPVCLGMVRATVGTATIAAPSLRRNESAYKTISNSLSTLHTAGLEIDFNEYHRDFNDSVRLLDLPAYAYDDKNYWIQYEGDWCLTKGGPVPESQKKLLEPPKPKLSTTTVHTVTSEKVDGDVAIVSIESDLARPDLRGIVSGHPVNGSLLCPSSLYADMALTVCEYAYKLVRPDATNLGIDVARMKVPKPLIADPAGKSQILKLTVSANAATGRADLLFYTEEGKTKVDHANCVVFFGNTEEYLADLERSAYLIQSRVDWLQQAERNGKASKIGRGLAYKLFAALVDYDAKFRGMEEVILDSPKMEATARVVFQTTEKDGTFKCSPYWIDSVSHISGFIVNGSDAVDSREKVYISHGWDSMRFAEPLSAEKTYRSYVKMQPRKDKTMAGDVYIFDGDRIIGMVGGLAFQAIPRKVLNMFLPPVGAAASSAAAVKAAPKPQAPQKASTTTRTKAEKVVQKKQVSKANIASVNQKLQGITSKVMDILAAEVGVTLDELVDNIAFTDLGVDSLMALTVCGRIREELEIDIDSHNFMDYANIGAFKTFLTQFEDKSSATLVSEDASSPVTTPSIEESIHDPQEDSDYTTPSEDEESEDAPTETDNLGDIIRSTIAEEMDIDILEVASCPDLASLGMDSLMALTILGRLRERTGLSLPSDLFVVNTSIRDIEKALNIGAPSKPKPKAAPAKKPSPPPAAAPVAAVKTPVTSNVQAKPQRKANSILLQGNMRKASKYLWIVPDGSGSATSYTDIPTLSSDVAVFGLNSPFMKTPEEFDCGVVGIATYYIQEIKRRQPTGPYLLAGWSAGGVIAYEVVNQLTKANEVVDKLILIDTPCPDIIEPLPQSLHKWFASIGLLGDGDPTKIPEWLLPHFASSVQALSTYMPEPIDPKKVPQVMAIWCEDGVCKEPSDPRPDPFPYGHAQFLLDNRTDFGPYIWDKYLGLEKFETRHMPGNHFSMMHAPHVQLLGNFMKEALEK